MGLDPDNNVRDHLALVLGYIAGDYDTRFAPGKLLAAKHHRETADKLLHVFDIKPKDG